MPSHHLEADPQTLASVCGLLQQLHTLMGEVGSQDPVRPRIELAEVAPQVQALINQSLGHGEVSILVREPVAFRIQESIFAGIWRVQELSTGGEVVRDFIEAGGIPQVVPQSAEFAASFSAQPIPLPSGIMNSPAVLNELLDRSRNFSVGQATHVLNLSLLPMSPEDLDYLAQSLGAGSVTVLSRGYGNCRITSTGLRHVWWVQYFNSMDQIILNTLEVTDVPEVAQAAAEDYADSIERLGEWLAVMFAEDKEEDPA